MLLLRFAHYRRIGYLLLAAIEQGLDVQRTARGGKSFSRLLKNYPHCHCGVKKRLKMLIYHP